MFNDLIYYYRFLIGGILIAIILIGSGLIIWQKYGQSHNAKDSEIATLQQQNELLRQELSNQSQQVAGASTESQNTDEKININTSDLTALDKISGVGPAIAQRIIDWRSQNGNFQTIEDIKSVKGIGDATFEKMKDMITVGE